MIALTTNQLPKLLAIANLFEALHKNEIVYCNLKGNEQHLRMAMTGESDIDVLFDEKQKVKLESILNKLGFKKFNAIRQKQYKDIVDFMALDLESGKVIHLHTYYRLTIGEPYLKGYQLDIENHILNSRVFNEEFDMYCIQPAFELILLYLTASLKLRHRDLILMYLKNKINFSEKTVYEHNWLKKRTNDAEVEAVLKPIFKDYVTINNLVKSEFNRKQLQKLAPLIKKELSKYRLYSPLVALLLRWYRETTVTIFRKLSRILARPILSMRINPRGGIIVAVIGTDGAGKSTVTNLLRETFGKKLDVYKIDFGRREGKISLIRKLQLFKTSLSKEGFLRSIRKCMEALIVAQENSNKMKLVQTAKKKGALVICDRYPQNQIMGYNDGPILHDLLSSKNPFFRTFARMESKMYAQAESYSPDILFKLIADAERQKPGETSREKPEGKIIAGIKQLRFNNQCKVMTVDAAKPLKEVLYIMKKEIWNIL